MKIDIWSDVLCPWCAVGRGNLDKALASFADEEVQIRWRSFELNPSMEREVQGDYKQKLADKYGKSLEEMQAWIDVMVERGNAVGVEFDFDVIKPGNSFDAHRLVHLAKQEGKQDAMKQRLFRAYLKEGVAIGRKEALVQLAADVGLSADRVTAVLGSDEFAADVRADQQAARQIGVSGVPFMVFDERLAVSGAQPAEVLVQAIQQVLDTREPANFDAEAAACGPDGCEL